MTSLDSEEIVRRGCVIELNGISSKPELNGLRGLCMCQTKEQKERGRMGIHLNNGEQLSVAVKSVTSLIEFREIDSWGYGQQGAFAKFKLKSGDLLLREKPAICGRLNPGPSSKRFKALPASEQKAVFELCDTYARGQADKTLEGIFASNALPKCSDPEELALCVLGSRINHSCAPNAEYLWSETLQMEEVRAVRDIEPGEEVCVSYVGDAILQPRSVRQEHIREGFRFVCRCSACIVESGESDRRRLRLTTLREEILGCRDSPEKGLQMAEEMLELLQKENISAPRTVAQICNDGFELSMLMGDDSEAQVWAHMSYEAHRLGWGEQNEMTRRMLHYTQHPPSLADSQRQKKSAKNGDRKPKAANGKSENGLKQDTVTTSDSKASSKGKSNSNNATSNLNSNTSINTNTNTHSTSHDINSNSNHHDETSRNEADNGGYANHVSKDGELNSSTSTTNTSKFHNTETSTSTSTTNTDINAEESSVSRSMAISGKEVYAKSDKNETTAAAETSEFLASMD
eukprot:TRINITY_DN15032_c2_g1_i1.p1 TRINITY_DN15032_c2_g1~~TRINITY_DN15032_c2_g1_i1.p1  ORF type:complete len:517 (+),score=104.24 TRINITY_DN15032_c2_g1_i1:40-1590(+)